ncbi:helix-turn-helix transcriptional regulator [Moraxella nonliquefaciens]|uniref:WYL domain-containing protein n=1 Tax=Moraxella nonliquefaciens TaxID=478 RepID=A0A1B8QSA8_MORNO|nr:WYL domain-containing protein [Moraxella nonliquefaciens]OBX87234.1 hypothetical protein A7456_08865 [Moraxella nonliquefaciens]QPT44137.1 WYL domain-containing protein [Moraxella nonliquefaciens]QQC29156.1 WYL domain-containing protein [Moraxella nonliquefaciens]
MSKSNSDGVLFLLELLRLIPRHGKITAKDLQQKLANLGYPRSERTIQRQLDMISHHFAIERDDRAKPYGYAWAKDAKTLELAGLSAEQSLLLSLAYDELRFLLPANISHGLNGFFESAERHLRNQTKPEVSAWRNKVASVPPTFPLLPPAIDDDVFASISQALFENRYLDIIYQAHRKKPKPDTVMPLALVRQEPRLYLVVKYKGYEDIRHLAVNRIKSATISLFDFERPDDFKLQDYIAKGHFSIGDGSQVRLSFCIDKHQGFHLTETPLSTDQIIQEFDHHYHISATVPDSEMLDWWLAKFGDDVWDIKKR